MDDITDPMDVLLAEVRTAREELRKMLDRTRREHQILEDSLELLTKSSRLTEEQRARLHRALRRARRPV